MRYIVIDRLREEAICWRDIIWIDKYCAHLAENKSAHAKATNDDTRHKTGMSRIPEPSVVHRNHIGKSIGQAEASSEEEHEGVKWRYGYSDEIETTSECDTYRYQPKKVQKKKKAILDQL